MAKNIIHIFGASGSGTSTLGRKICLELGYKFMDTDDYYWLPTDPKYTTKRNVKERLAMMKNDIEEAENVVISGSLVDWGDELIPLFTLAVRVETATDVRIARLKQREKELFGSRIDIGGDMFFHHQNFIAYAKSYDTGDLTIRSKVKHDEWQKLLQCKLIVINGADDLNVKYEIIKKELDNYDKEVMKQCKNCIFYDEEYDRLRQSGDDIIIVGEEFKEKHYCSNADDEIIDDKIVNNEKKCKHFIDKKDF